MAKSSKANPQFHILIFNDPIPTVVLELVLQAQAQIIETLNIPIIVTFELPSYNSSKNTYETSTNLLQLSQLSKKCLLLNPQLWSCIAPTIQTLEFAGRRRPT